VTVTLSSEVIVVSEGLTARVAFSGVANTRPTLMASRPAEKRIISDLKRYERAERIGFLNILFLQSVVQTRCYLPQGKSVVSLNLSRSG
jgi:hypothetical protein